MTNSSSSALAFSDGGDPPEVPHSLWDWLISDFDPQARAFAVIHQPASHLAYLCRDAKPVEKKDSAKHLEWSYDQLKTAALRVAAFLSSQIEKNGKSRKGQTVIVSFIWNRVEYAIFFLAAVALGMPFSPLDPTYLDQAEDFRYFSECLEPGVILVENAEAAEKVNKLGSNAYVKVMCESSKTTSLPDWHVFDHLPQETDNANSHPVNLSASTNQNISMVKKGAEDKKVDTLPDDTVLIGFSSGTSGDPKGCPVTAYALALQAEGYLRMRPLQRNAHMTSITVSLNFRPICYLSCFTTWKTGGLVVFPAPKFDPAATIRAIASEGGTHTNLVPPQASALMREPTLQEVPVTSLQFVSLGGNIVSDQFLREFQEALSVKRVLSVWGMTEGAGIVGWDRDDEEIPANPHGLAAIGRALPGVKVRISDPQSEQPKTISRGIIGDFHVSSAANISRYLFNRNDEEFYTDDEGSWFITGDHAKMDESGIIYVVGRSKDSINRNGTIVVPGDIEACLNKISGVESQVVGIPDSEQGEVPVAIIRKWPDSESGEQVTKSKLEKTVVNEVGEDASLSGVFTLDDLQMSDWPYNTTAKILKKDLTDAVVRLMEKD